MTPKKEYRRVLRLAVVQMNSRIGEIENNLSKIEGFVSSAAEDGCNMICFPEASLTGYTSDAPERFAISLDSEPVSELIGISRRYDITIVTGIIESSASKPHITQFAVSPKGLELIYRKTHLGTAESSVFEQGDKIGVAELCGTTVGLHLCWESHIPEISTTLRVQNAGLVLVPHSTGSGGEKRRAIWSRILAARADDNGMYVAACNSAGDNGLGTITGGGCVIIGPKGNILSEYYGEGEKMITADILDDLPRDDAVETMGRISYFDRRRPGIYRSG